MTTTLLLFEEPCELVHITDTILSGAHANLSGVVSVNETLFGELYEINALVWSKSIA